MDNPCRLKVTAGGMSIGGIMSPSAELAGLYRKPGTFEALGVVTINIFIIAIITLVEWQNRGCFLTIIATIVLATRFKALNNIVHECSHLSFHRRREWNELTGKALAALLFQDFGAYKAEHMSHHQCFCSGDGRPSWHGRAPGSAAGPWRIWPSVRTWPMAWQTVWFLVRRNIWPRCGRCIQLGPERRKRLAGEFLPPSTSRSCCASLAHSFGQRRAGRPMQ